MIKIDEVCSILHHHNYCINPHSKSLYLLFLKEFIERHLNDTERSYIFYISTSNNKIPVYSKILSSNDRLVYISEEIIPSSLPANFSLVYIYHPTYVPSKDNQLKLVEFIKAHPFVIYIYVGKVHKLLDYARVNLFNYYLHFEGRITNINKIYYHYHKIFRLSICLSLCKKYCKQNEKKTKAENPIIIYDYFLFHDIIRNETKIVKFNRRKYMPRNLNEDTTINIT
ncbi:MAG: hypothetical protein QXW79_00625 [Thermoplasmata archaeon]